MKIIIATQNGAASGTTATQFLLRRIFRVFCRAFFRGPELCCSCAASLHFVLQNISSWECSRLAFARPVSMLLTCVEYDFSSLGVGRRTCLARDTNVGFRQMMQFWNHLIMSYHA